MGSLILVCAEWRTTYINNSHYKTVKTQWFNKQMGTHNNSEDLICFSLNTFFLCSTITVYSIASNCVKDRDNYFRVAFFICMYILFSSSFLQLSSQTTLLSTVTVHVFLFTCRTQITWTWINYFLESTNRILYQNLA